jgi:hypothetical protein
MSLRVELEAKSKSEMIGEFLRELAVLVLVFVPLEAYISCKEKDSQNGLLGGWTLIASIASSTVFLAVGIWFERRRR